MDFANQLAIGASVTALCFLVLSGLIAIRQRRRRRKSIHWFSVFLLSMLIGLGAGMGIHLFASDPMTASGDITESVDLNTPSR